MRYLRSHTTGATFFFTVVTFQRRKILCVDGHAELIKDAFRYVHDRHPFRVDAFVMLPDHIHCIWSLPDNDGDFSTRWRLIKSYFSRRCTAGYDGEVSESRRRKGEREVWQRRFWEHQIRDEPDFARHVEYIHYNPVKHGYVKAPVEWPYSSFHRYVREGVYDNAWGEGREVVFDEGIGNE